MIILQKTILVHSFNRRFHLVKLVALKSGGRILVGSRWHVTVPWHTRWEMLRYVNTFLMQGMSRAGED
jgi:hypothetical protein